MGKIIAIANQKGGVGKTTTTVNLSACVAERGKRVLCIDIDPQGNCTSGAGVDKEAPEHSIYDVLINGVPAGEAAVPGAVEGLFVIPARKELSGAEPSTTNNRMELLGVITALEALSEPCSVDLYSDSKYVVDGITKGWAKGWRAKGWVKSDKKPAKNPELWDGCSICSTNTRSGSTG